MKERNDNKQEKATSSLLNPESCGFIILDDS